MKKKIWFLFLVLILTPLISAGNLCQYANSASATSENPGSLAKYATGAPNAPKSGVCSGWNSWSGYGYTWSPNNWDVKGVLTLKYNKPVNASNFTIIGDYDMCWVKMSIKNSATGQQKEVFNGYDNSCVSTKKLDESFSADTIILETCGWGWSSTDAVEMCGKDNTSSTNVCRNSLIEQGEECDNSQCASTKCDNLDRCNGNDYYDYSDVLNSCLSNCSCEHKSCTIANISHNDSRCLAVPICGNNIINAGEECDDGNIIDDDGCSSECKMENVTVYFVPYMGDIDGSIDTDWYLFYEKLMQWHKDNNMPGSFSFYPDTMNNPEFNKIIGNMHNTPEIELITKGEDEYNNKSIDLMNYSEVKSAIGVVQNKFVTELTNLNYTNVAAPVTYNQRSGKFTPTIRDAIHDLGFKIYLEQYVSEYGYIPMLPDFDITQYSVSLTISGLPGADEVYKTSDQVTKEILNFTNPNMIYINGIKVVPLLSHQQDFRISENSSVLNQTKWDVYTGVLQNARKDPRIKVLKPIDVYNMRHSNVSTIRCGNGILEAGEQCDDGNNVSGDGCDKYCKIESNTYSAEVCDWQNCTKGAASISIDDADTSCLDKLNAHGFKGTYFLLNTRQFSQSTWDFWNNVYNEGHELGGHTESHYCTPISNFTLRNELSSNINDILTNIRMPKEELVSFAWPCGFNTESEKQIASEYFLGSRGYYWNQLEDKNPVDFMDLKSFNTPGYNNNALPPNYLSVADMAESQEKWANFVFHDSCNDDGVINYLPSKNLWVAPIGKVTKYIIERQNAEILNLQASDSFIRFDLVNNLNHSIYNQELSLKILTGDKTTRALKINNLEKPFTSFSENNKNYIKFNVLPSGNDKIEINLQSGNCIDNDKDGYYAISADCLSGNDCDDNNAEIHPKADEKKCNGIDDDCDLLIDEDYVVKVTDCGIGVCKSTGQLTCSNGAETNSCAPGLPLSVNDSTCDGIDDNCNGVVDENCFITNTTNLCQYASSASATSENPGSTAKYAIGVPNAPKSGICSGWNSWSGYGYTWSPNNWNAKGVLTLKYDKPVNASNFTIIGDYDMCWVKMSIKNSATGQQKEVFNGYDNSCVSTKKLDESFSADTIILETCGWGWSSTDAVEMCGKLS